MTFLKFVGSFNRFLYGVIFTIVGILAIVISLWGAGSMIISPEKTMFTLKMTSEDLVVFYIQMGIGLIIGKILLIFGLFLLAPFVGINIGQNHD